MHAAVQRLTRCIPSYPVLADHGPSLDTKILGVLGRRLPALLTVLKDSTADFMLAVCVDPRP